MLSCNVVVREDPDASGRGDRATRQNELALLANGV
jgi:hypothetical protein